VKAVLPNLPQDLVAWAVEGHTSVGADKILLAISNSNKVKTHVKAQIVEAGKTLGDGLREVPDALVAVSTLAVIAFRENVVKLV
jgi:hypothetical protein